MTDIKTGLTAEEAQIRLQKDGKNALREEKPKTILKMFVEQMFNFTNLILVVAALSNVVLHEIIVSYCPPKGGSLSLSQWY